MKKLLLILILPCSLVANEFFKEVCQPQIDKIISPKKQTEIVKNASYFPSVISTVTLGASAVGVLRSMRESYFKAFTGVPTAAALLLGGVKEVQKIKDLNITTDVNPYFNCASALISSAALASIACTNIRKNPGIFSKVISSAQAYTAYQQLNDGYKAYKKI